MTNGIPSEDTFRRVLARLDPTAFETALLGWMQAMLEITGHRLVAIDGKTLRGSYNKRDGKAAIHMVSAWATENKLSLGQVVVDEKSNEITAIPALLELLELSGAVVTIDAMGCLKEIAATIRERGGDYVLAVELNQPTLYEQIVNRQSRWNSRLRGVRIQRSDAPSRRKARSWPGPCRSPGCTE